MFTRFFTERKTSKVCFDNRQPENQIRNCKRSAYIETYFAVISPNLGPFLSNLV